MKGDEMARINMMSRSLLLTAGLLLLILAACTAESEPEVTLEPMTAVEETSVPEPTVTSEPTETAEEMPSPTPEPLPLMSPTPVPQPTAGEGEQLPVVEELAFTVSEQYGGVPHALAVDGTTVYVGFGPRLFVLDASDSANPQLLGQSEPLPDIIRGVEVADGLAYLAGGRGGLIVLDVADPLNLTTVSEGPNYAGADQPSAEAVDLVGDTAYVTDFNRMDGSTELLRFDISDPAAPALMDTLELAAGESAVVDDGVIIVTSTGRLELRDATEPTAVLSEIALASGAFASRVVVHENTLIVAETGESNGVERFDISNPAEPVALGELATMEFFFISGSATDGQTLFLETTFGEFGHCGSEIHSIGLSGETPQLLNRIDPENCITELALAGRTLFVAGRSGLQLYDTSDPASLTLISQFRNPAGFHGAESIAVRDGIGYVLAGEGRSFDIATIHLDQPDQLAGERVTVGTETLLDLFITGDTLVAQVWMGGLNTLDIAEPAAPQLLHQAVLGDLLTGDYSASAVGDGVVYTAVISDTLVGAVGAIDLSDPANPTLAGVVETGESVVMSLALGDGMLFALTQGEVSEIQYIDVSQPLQPQLSGTVRLPEAAGRLEMVGDTLFAICDGFNCRNLYSLDVSDAGNSVPPPLAQWELPVGAIETESDGEAFIYLMTQEDGIWVLNAADPANPYLAGRFDIANNFARLELVGDTIYAAAFDAGLYEIQINP